MPTYAYRCTDCGHAFDVQQSFTDSSLTVCPSCGGVLRKVFSPIGVTFSGSGFYRTDSRAAGKKGDKKDAAAAGSDSPTPKKDEKAAATSKEHSQTSKSTSTSKPTPATSKKASGNSGSD